MHTPLLTATANGFGKRTALAEYPKKGRGTQGVIAIQTSERNGALVGAIQVLAAHDIMLISNQGTLVRTGIDTVSRVGRNTQGVTLIRLPQDEVLASVVSVQAFGDEDVEGDAPVSAPSTGEPDDGTAQTPVDVE